MIDPAAAAGNAYSLSRVDFARDFCPGELQPQRIQDFCFGKTGIIKLLPYAYEMRQGDIGDVFAQ